MPSPTNLSQLLVDAYIYQICIKDLAELKDVVNRSFIFLLSRQLMSTNSIFVTFIVFLILSDRLLFSENISGIIILEIKSVDATKSLTLR